MFVLVKQESFAAVSVGIMKLSLPVFLLTFGVRGEYEALIYMKVEYLDFFVPSSYCCDCSVFQSRFYGNSVLPLLFC